MYAVRRVIWRISIQNAYQNRLYIEPLQFCPFAICEMLIFSFDAVTRKYLRV